ncbi:Cytochrome P450 - like 10 [Theobroma cacao]|nr:Cytochrome P450 - like 10 [Theobroma cacao]
MREIYSDAWPLFMITTALAVIFLLANLVLTKKARKRICKLPPGRRGWPLLGDSISWYNAVASSHPPLYVEEQVKRFGKIFSCSLFGKWAVVSADPSFNRFVMLNEGKLFQSSYPKSFRDLVGKNGVITVQGEQQRNLHAIASNMMRLDKLKSHFLEDIQKVVLQTLSRIQDNRTILLQDLAINLMVNQLLGVSSEAQINEMAQLFSDFVDGCLSVPINWPGFAYHTAMKAREKIISEIFITIEKRKQEGASEVGNGVLGRLLIEENLADDAVADFIINLLFAGNETTAKTMLFAVYFLTQCPRALTQLRDEQNSVRPNSGEEMLTWQDYKAMSFTQCILSFPKDALLFHFSQLFTWMKICTRELYLSIPGDGWILKMRKRGIGEAAPFIRPSGEVLGFVLEQSWLVFKLLSFYTILWIQLKQDRMSFFPSARLVNGFQIRPIKRHKSKQKEKG